MVKSSLQYLYIFTFVIVILLLLIIMGWGFYYRCLFANLICKVSSTTLKQLNIAHTLLQ